MTTRLDPDAPRRALRRLVKASPLKQREVASAVGEREDAFSNRLAGRPHAVIDASLMVAILNAIDVDFKTFARLVEAESGLDTVGGGDAGSCTAEDAGAPDVAYA
jgi:transcriptional regulator with XRE-family HTH domain